MSWRVTSGMYPSPWFSRNVGTDSSKKWYTSTRLHGDTSNRAVPFTATGVCTSDFIFLPTTCKTTHPNKDEHTASSLVHVQRDICYHMSQTVATPWFGIAQSVQWLGYELDELIRRSRSRKVTRLFSTPKCPGRISGPPSPYSVATETPSRAMKCQRRDPHH